MQGLKQKLSNPVYKVWFSLFVVSTIGVIIMISSTYVDQYTRRETWKEFFILYLYFTFMSNMFGVITSFLVMFTNVQISSKHLQRTKVMMSVNLTVTFLIFWSVLSTHITEYPPFTLVATICVHVITPVLAVFAFIYEGRKTKLKKNDYIDPKATMIINLLFPFLWLIMALTLYFAMGADSESAIYNFLDFNKGVLLPSIVLPSIAIAYPLFTFGYAWLYRK